MSEFSSPFPVLNKDLELSEVQICSVCGHTTQGEAPDRCPVCGQPKQVFVAFKK